MSECQESLNRQDACPPVCATRFCRNQSPSIRRAEDCQGARIPARQDAGFPFVKHCPVALARQLDLCLRRLLCLLLEGVKHVDRLRELGYVNDAKGTAVLAHPNLADRQSAVKSTPPAPRHEVQEREPPPLSGRGAMRGSDRIDDLPVAGAIPDGEPVLLS